MKPLAEVLEDAIRKAIDEASRTSKVSEELWLEALDEALEMIREGVKMRIGELS